MLDLNCYMHSLKLTWLRRYYKASPLSCTLILFKHFLQNKAIHVWDSGSIYLQTKMELIVNDFYKDILSALIHLRKSINSDIRKKPNTLQSLWLNDLIQVGNSPILNLES